MCCILNTLYFIYRRVTYLLRVELLVQPKILAQGTAKGTFVHRVGDTYLFCLHTLLFIYLLFISTLHIPLNPVVSMQCIVRL